MNRLLLTYRNEKICAAIVSEDRLVDYAEYSDSPRGCIYKARVERKLTEINAFFADVGAKKQVFVNGDDVPGIPLAGQNLMLQITRPAHGKKAATASGRIKLSGEYLVYLPNADKNGISKKITAAAERARLIEFLKTLENNRFVVRTAAVHATDEQLRSEAQLLISRWHQLCKRFTVEKQPRLLYREYDFVYRYLRDNLNLNSITEVVTNDDGLGGQVSDYCAQTSSACKVLVVAEKALFEYCHLADQISRLSEREVVTSDGIRIVFDSCEAVTAVDVNSGSYANHNAAVAATVAINAAAAVEIVRQIRLRNVSGIIVIDFLKMNESGREEITRVVEKNVGDDVSNSEILGFTRAGLFEIVRKSRFSDSLVDKSDFAV